MLHWLFNENLGDFFPEKAYEMADTIEEKEKQIIKYKQALDKIEARIQLENADDCLLDVMEIIESVKEKNNDSLSTKVLCKLHKTSI